MSTTFKKIHLDFNQLSQNLTEWYLQNRRDLPWRQNKDPYLIWISEVMLQQTTVQSVIPYFQKFKLSFPTVRDLAQAPLEEVLLAWSGLGYYSRARNLHKAAQLLADLPEFPQTAEALLALPGFGPYTSRAVASIAFEQSVGVVDGNVIRILSRLLGEPLKWWHQKDRVLIQNIADQLVEKNIPSLVNQGMMELGATICTPKSPACILCPWLSICRGRQKHIHLDLPVKRPRKDSIIIKLDLKLIHYKDQVVLQENQSLPFLKNSLLPPFEFKALKVKPNNFHFRHSITHYDIYVTITDQPKRKCSLTHQWFRVRDLAKHNPSSLLSKAIKHSQYLLK